MKSLTRRWHNSALRRPVLARTVTFALGRSSVWGVQNSLHLFGVYLPCLLHDRPPFLGPTRPSLPPTACHIGSRRRPSTCASRSIPSISCSPFPTTVAPLQVFIDGLAHQFRQGGPVRKGQLPQGLILIRVQVDVSLCCVHLLRFCSGHSSTSFPWAPLKTPPSGRGRLSI